MNIRQSLGISCFIAAVIAIARFTSRESDKNTQIQLQAFTANIPAETPSSTLAPVKKEVLASEKAIQNKVTKPVTTSKEVTHGLIKKHFFETNWKMANDKDIDAYFQKIKIVPTTSQEGVGSQSFRKTWTAKLTEGKNTEFKIVGLSDAEGKSVKFTAAILTQDGDDNTWQSADRIVTDLTNEKLLEQRISDTFQFWKTESLRTVTAEKIGTDDFKIKWVFEFASE